MGPPTEDTCKLISYLVETCPAALETKNSDGATPLMTACWFGRPEFVKILLDGGADQSVRNKAGQNILHMALVGKPRAKQLRSLLKLLDAELMDHLFVSRTNLHESGTTPLHAFVTAVTSPQTTYYYRRENEYKEEKHWLATLKVLLEHSKGAELEMLNGAGDTCLHTAVMQSSAAMVQALLDFRPKLLYRENAVGRTPAEVARDRVTAEKFEQPGQITIPNRHNSVVCLATKPPSAYVDDDGEDKDEQPKKKAEGSDDSSAEDSDEDSDDDESVGKKKKSSESAKQKVWRICLEAIRKNPDKRRLVSLNEANDVAKRLGEKQTPGGGARHFSIQARDDDEEEEEKDDDDEKKDKDKNDFSMVQRGFKWGEAWRKREWQLPLCEDCGKRHEEDEEDMDQ